MVHRFHADEWLFAAAAGLALFGVVMVYSASAAMVVAAEGANSYALVIKQGVWTLIGLGVMILAMRVDYERWRDPRVMFSLLGLTVLLLVAVFAFPRINGARRWIHFGGFSMQPSELAKIALTIYLARFLERRAGREESLRETFLPAMVIIAALAALVLAEPDFGTALMLIIIGFVMLYAAGAQTRHLGAAIVPALLVGIVLVVFVPWRFARMTAFLDPWAEAQGKGFQVVQSLIAVGSGGVNGLGFANGKQKLLFLPFAHSDFIFAVIGEELGLVGALALVAVFGIFLWRGLRAALSAPDRFGMLLGIGIVTSIVAQALLNMSVVLSLVPTKGIPLPFVSYGGSSLIPTMFAVGILLNISQNQSRVWSLESRVKSRKDKFFDSRLQTPDSRLRG